MKKEKTKTRVPRNPRGKRQRKFDLISFPKKRRTFLQESFIIFLSKTNYILKIVGWFINKSLFKELNVELIIQLAKPYYSDTF